MSSENQKNAVARPIFTWTRFRVPETEPIFEIDYRYPPSEERQKWADAICPLTEAPGFQRASWARIKETPDTVVLGVDWSSLDELESFKASPSYTRYYVAISTFSEPEEIVMKRSGTSIATMLRNELCLSMVRVHFTHPTNDAHRANVAELSGLRSPLPIMPKCFTHRELPDVACRIVVRPVWALSPTKRMDGLFVDTMLWFHIWASPEREDQFKRETRHHYGEDGIDFLLPEEWLNRKLSSLGALDWSEEHFQPFIRIEKRFNGEPKYGPFRRGEKKICP
ncbi:Antibiotic biosynthesis monooxygenase [Macrophomina phaseolina MS6]|uniref:Antibiotic biosynthesis monooxygenase n=1 Tax=Macrophomina phaseolina (strain MS6) TaxID=1126212 RepID=K2SSM7_MACPH|nr:Antibiotic biosynthesis monooxygenase [Macrophomina phaseolina MS6]